MYPRLCIYKSKIKSNAENLLKLTKENNVEIAAVTKVLSGNPEIAKVLKEAGIKMIADSRISNIKKMISKGIEGPFMLLRIPMMSRIQEIVKYVDYTLISEIETAKKLGAAAVKLNTSKKIIIMIDVGDLREGIWFENAVEQVGEFLKIKGLELSGIGTNLGCFGGVLPSVENMNLLKEIKEKIEDKYSIKLEIISGGNTAAIPLIRSGQLPKEINHFRLGESIICGTDVTNDLKIEGNTDLTVILEAEIIELKEKPSVPIGEIGFDAFGRKPHFEDKGIRKKCILGVGEQDIISSGLYSLDEKVEILHASSDHTIIDVTESDINYKVGDILKFKLSYGCLLKASTSEYVEKVIFE